MAYRTQNGIEVNVISIKILIIASGYCFMAIHFVNKFKTT